MRKFTYDVFTLIELVETKPCLWDKTLDDFRNKILRRNAWREICTFLEPEFESMDEKNKNETIDTVTSKWSGIRDTFMKSLKTKSGDGQKKKYMYSNNLQFLLKIFTPQQTVSNINEDQVSASEASTSRNDSVPLPCITNASSSEETTDTGTSPQRSASRNNNMPQIRNKKRMNPVDVEILKAIQCTESRSTEQPHIDEDLAFLQSILPSMKKIADEEKLEFRIQLMKLVQKFTKKIKQQSAEMNTTNDNSYNISIPLQNIEPNQSEVNEARQTISTANHNIINQYIPVPSQNIELNQIQIIEEMQAVEIPNELYQYINIKTQNMKPNQSEVDEGRQNAGIINEDNNFNLDTAMTSRNTATSETQTAVNSILYH